MNAPEKLKDTLNLPKTDFPMRANAVVREPARMNHWETSGSLCKDAKEEPKWSVLCAARRSSLYQWRCACGHGT